MLGTRTEFLAIQFCSFCGGTVIVAVFVSFNIFFYVSTSHCTGKSFCSLVPAIGFYDDVFNQSNLKSISSFFFLKVI